jgi:hypothetical protein
VARLIIDRQIVQPLQRPLRPSEEVVLTVTDTVSNESKELPNAPEVTESSAKKPLLVPVGTLVLRSGAAQDIHEAASQVRVCRTAAEHAWSVPEAERRVRRAALGSLLGPQCALQAKNPKATWTPSLPQQMMC